MPDAVPSIDAKRSALLVMDYQAGVIGMLGDAATDLIERAQQAIGTAHAAGMTVGYVRVAFTDDDIASFPATSRMAQRVSQSGRALHADSPTTAIDERVAPRDGDIIVRKTRVGAFSTTDLDAQLRARGIDTLVLAGISTSGVVLSTVRDASDKDYALFVLKDATADPDPETHACLMERVLPRQADVIDVNEFAVRLVADAT